MVVEYGRNFIWLCDITVGNSSTACRKEFNKREGTTQQHTAHNKYEGREVEHFLYVCKSFVRCVVCTNPHVS